MDDSPPNVGDIVIANGSATWIRSGSDKLPWQQVPKRVRDDTQIPINLLADELFHELMQPSKVLSLSRDLAKVKVPMPTSLPPPLWLIAKP